MVKAQYGYSVTNSVGCYTRQKIFKYSMKDVNVVNYVNSVNYLSVRPC